MNLEYDPNISPVVNFEQKAKGRYKIQILDENGVVNETDWKPNLILDTGLDKIAYMPWAQAFQVAVAGTSTTPTKDDTQSASAQAGTLVSITSGSYGFTSQDVGKLIYWPALNQSAKITAFIASTAVSVSDTKTVSDSYFVLYRVNQTSLFAQVKQNNYYLEGSNYCGHEVTGNVIRLYRTFDFHMEFSSRTYGEIGFKESPGATQLFSRVVLNPTQTIRAGQFLRVNYELYVTLSPSTPNYKQAPISGWPVAPSTSLSGNEQIQMIGLCGISSNGVAYPIDSNAGFCNEPFAPGTTSFGPGYGMVNRWRNPAAYSTDPNSGANPLKKYTTVDANPFRGLGGPTHEDILPALSAITNQTAPSISSLITPLQLSSRFNTSLNKISVSATNSVTNYFYRYATAPDSPPATNSNPKHAFPTNGSTIGVTPTFTGSWQNARTDLLRPVIEYSTTTGNSNTAPAGEDFLFDPYIQFPAFVPQPINETYATYWPDWTVKGASVFLSSLSSAPASIGTCNDCSFVGNSATQCYEIPLELVPYTPGSFTRTKYAMFLTDDGNGTNWYTLGVGGTDINIDPSVRTNAARYNGFVFVFDQPQTKASTYVLQVSFRYTWNRDLSTS